MSSGRAGEMLCGTGASDPSVKGKIVVEGSSPGLDAGQEEGWEVYSRKSKNRAGTVGGKQCFPRNSTSKSWDETDVVQKLGMRSNARSGKGSEDNSWHTQSTERIRPDGRTNRKLQPLLRGIDNNNAAATPAIGPPLRNGWDWSTRAASAQLSDELGRKNNMASVNLENVEDVEVEKVEDEDNDSDVLDDSDDEFLSDGFDSDASEKSHETCKKDRWFKELFECLDSLTIEQISEPDRQWHCPACKGGPGAIEWYNGLQPLITHAKTKGSIRVKLHRKLAELLEEELRRRGASVTAVGEVFGLWNGLDEKVEKEIVWPPMVIITNTILERDGKDKWIGMGNQELLDCFSSYDVVRARHSYGPKGHRGISVLIFKASAIGYLEAERLSKHFENNGKDRTAWESRRVAFCPGGKRQLFGYMAEKRDLEDFNRHSQGKMKLKFETCSYQEMVVKQLKQMSEDNEQLIWIKDKLAEEKKHSKALEEANSIVSERYRKSLEENRIVRQRTKKHHEQNKEEMDAQEQFFKEQLKMIYDAREAQEEDFENIQQEEREAVTQSQVNPFLIEDHRNRAEKVAKFIQCQDQEMEEFDGEREKLIKLHEGRMFEMQRRYWEEKVALEKEFDAELAELMKKYTPDHSDQLVNSNNSST